MEETEADEDARILDRFKVFNPSASTVCTEAFGKFLTEFRAHSDLFFFIVEVVARADESRLAAAKALASAGASENDRKRYNEILENPDVVLKELKKHSTVTSQNLTNGIVNSFQRYFSSIIQSAATKKPIMLSSSQHVRLDDVLKFSRHRDLISFIIDRKINERDDGSRRN